MLIVTSWVSLPGHNLPESLAFTKRSLVGVVAPVRGGRRHGDGGRAHDSFTQPHFVMMITLKESTGEMLSLEGMRTEWTCTGVLGSYL